MTHLVGHSQGGLVGLAALAGQARYVGKVVVIGVPVHGLFATVLGLRGRHWLLHALAALDGAHTAHELATNVFASWPSVYEMLPPPWPPSSIDFFDPDAWPKLGPRPRRELLTRARPARVLVSGARGEIHVIAGYGWPTVDRVDVTERGFVYHRSTDGDGWVPTSRTTLPGLPTYFARAPHLLLPSDPDVVGAVVDLLASGDTGRLPTSAPVPRPAPDEVDDVDAPVVFGGRGGAAITRRDVEAVLAQLLRGGQP